MKKLVMGILAHVDAGKTTCIENMLYTAGAIRSLGRVDNRDAFLDFDSQEREHGITIYSKEAYMTYDDTEIYVIDTPGHADFSAEMERVLGVLDLAVLLISARDGVQSHTETIWKCLEHYHVPTVVFINKMDLVHPGKDALMEDLHRRCSPNIIDMTDPQKNEKLALVHDDILNRYMETGEIDQELLRASFAERNMFPCLFGAALKGEGIRELMDTVTHFAPEKTYPDEFGGRVYKISQDENGSRLSHVRITGGVLKAKQKLGEEDKVDQIRRYSGRNYTLLQEAEAGSVCVLKGPQTLEAGMGLGFEEDLEKPVLDACMSYLLTAPRGADMLALSETCRRLAEEDPQLHIRTDEESGKIEVQLMGLMQMEVLQKKIEERCGIHTEFSTGRILYKETVASSVIGVGHFEPLRHYAECVVRISPLERGKGILIDSRCPTDELSSSWQKQILNALGRRRHRGVLTGSELTDVRITLIAGKAHLKHTEGGDFAQASSRAVRQGLMKAENVLLEPFYSYELEIPEEYLGRALFDLETRQASSQVKQEMYHNPVITGRGPVRTMQNYQNEVTAYTKGRGRFSCEADGYDVCRSSEAVIAETGYDPDSDLRNPTGSVFCANGSGYYVPWYETEDHMHIELRTASSTGVVSSGVRYRLSGSDQAYLEKMTAGKDRGNVNEVKKKPVPAEKPYKGKEDPIKPNCLIVDGYNLIYAWDELSQIARDDITTARERLIERICEYQAYTKEKTYIVFDGYRVKDNPGTRETVGNVTVIYTKSKETADEYIEKLADELQRKYRMTVVTSDSLIQNSVLARGALRMSAREMEYHIDYLRKRGRM
ncbi:MAG: NYN domain-containing protein [Solobacterium sp.]|nr:NYN domain-containing protein [Solobacterium sp.]